ncbi:(methyl)glyoxal oxidase [Malassezia sp. CBS 17886]|nr:(methyl)glyoxal oxidase [Malassezia sp. CBS 17886]
MRPFGRATTSSATGVLGLCLSTFAWVAAPALGDQKPLQYNVVQPNSLASAMMLGLANENTAFIFDKVEGNRAKTNTGKPVWSALVDLNDDFNVRAQEATSNPFCASGATLGNGTWIVVGGNQAIGYGGEATSSVMAPYYDNDGRRVVRIMEPNTDGSKLSWIDQVDSPNQMDSQRWYPGIEVLADGSVVLIGGASSGGFINRNYPNVDPAYATMDANPPAGAWNQGGSNPSYEFWPPTGKPAPQLSKFMVSTSGLNMYAHTYLMPSGKIFMQANYSTVMWDWQKNNEEALPDMPEQIIRVYPASGATAMLPLTPANKYTPTILFCGGSYMDDKDWGNYTGPATNAYKVEASKDCSSITPENSDGSAVKNVQYQHEQSLPEGRSMGQFIHLPTGQMVIVNGGSYGVAGFGNLTFNNVTDSQGNRVLLEGFAQKPTNRPVLYDPEKPIGHRLKYKGYGNSSIARLYHSSAILIPDGSVLIAGSNPHNDVSTTKPKAQTPYEWYPTEYAIEQWYPDYYFKPRPKPQGVPKVIKYGGSPFNITIDGDYMGKSANKMANATKLMVIRPGFSTHAMNMGQRSLQLDNSYEVHEDGSVTFMVNPMPTNMNIFVPGPALFFATVNGVPSNGTFVSIGGDNLGMVPFKLVAGDAPPPLPHPVDNPNFNGHLSTPTNDDLDGGSGLSGGAIAGIVVAVVAFFALVLAVMLFLLRRERRNKADQKYSAIGAGGGRGGGPVGAAAPWTGTTPGAITPTPSQMQLPLAHPNESNASFADMRASTEMSRKDQLPASYTSFTSLPPSPSPMHTDMGPPLSRQSRASHGDAIPMADMSAMDSPLSPRGTPVGNEDRMLLSSPPKRSNRAVTEPYSDRGALHTPRRGGSPSMSGAHGASSAMSPSPSRPVLYPETRAMGAAADPGAIRAVNARGPAPGSTHGPRDMPRSNLQQHLGNPGPFAYHG